jgi:hypothetical protein
MSSFHYEVVKDSSTHREGDYDNDTHILSSITLPSPIVVVETVDFLSILRSVAQYLDRYGIESMEIVRNE